MKIHGECKIKNFLKNYHYVFRSLRLPLYINLVLGLLQTERTGVK
jgi:hypothetical protein